MAKKSFNPFKMWGSYVGTLVGAYFFGVLTMFIQTKELDTALTWFIQFKEFCGDVCSVGNIIAVSILPLGGLIIGFLIGWGIHSLVRVIRK